MGFFIPESELTLFTPTHLVPESALIGLAVNPPSLIEANMWKQVGLHGATISPTSKSEREALEKAGEGTTYANGTVTKKHGHNYSIV